MWEDVWQVLLFHLILLPYYSHQSKAHGIIELKIVFTIFGTIESMLHYMFVLTLNFLKPLITNQSLYDSLIISIHLSDEFVRVFVSFSVLICKTRISFTKDISRLFVTTSILYSISLSSFKFGWIFMMIDGHKLTFLRPATHRFLSRLRNYQSYSKHYASTEKAIFTIQDQTDSSLPRGIFSSLRTEWTKTNVEMLWDNMPS